MAKTYGPYEFGCWHDHFADDDWRTVRAWDHKQAARVFFKQEAQKDFELDMIERLLVRGQGITKTFFCQKVPSVEYQVVEDLDNEGG